MEDAISEGRGEQEAALSDDDTITRDTPSMVTGSNTTASELTKADRDGRLLALENRIGLTPHTTKDLLSILDEAVGWDVNRAEAFFHRWQADRRNRRSWQDGLRTDEEDDISEPKSPNYKTSTEDVLGPVYLGGYTIDEHLSAMAHVEIELSDGLMGDDFT